MFGDTPRSSRMHGALVMDINKFNTLSNYIDHISTSNTRLASPNSFSLSPRHRVNLERDVYMR